MRQTAADWGGDGFAADHARLLKDGSLQFAFPEAPPPQPPPRWLEALGRLLEAVAPLAKWVFWGLIALAAAALAWFVVREILALRRRGWAKRTRPSTETVEWRPEPAQARALLEEADRLAAVGRYAEAAHVLLLRSIDDFHGRRPDLVRPALTSRDIAALEGLPRAARPAFALIAEVVERSLFGGRPVDAEAFGRCRGAYEQFALPGVW